MYSNSMPTPFCVCYSPDVRQTFVAWEPQNYSLGNKWLQTNKIHSLNSNWLDKWMTVSIVLEQTA